MAKTDVREVLVRAEASAMQRGVDVMDPDAVERYREAWRSKDGHEMAPVNYNSLRRLVALIDELAALSRPSPQPEVSGEDLDRLEKLARAATPGSWSMEDPFPNGFAIVEAEKPTHEWRFIAVLDLPEEDDHDFTGSEVTANAEYIAAFDPPTVLRLIAAARSPSAPAGEGRLEAILQKHLRWVKGYERSSNPGFAEAMTAVRVNLEAALARAASSDPPQEVERYREALAEIAKLPELSRDPADDFDRGSRAARSDAADIARAALQGEA